MSEKYPPMEELITQADQKRLQIVEAIEAAKATQKEKYGPDLTTQFIFMAPSR